MRFKINYELADGTEDFFVVQGADIDEVVALANAGVTERNAVDYYSEKLPD